MERCWQEALFAVRIRRATAWSDRLGGAAEPPIRRPVRPSVHILGRRDRGRPGNGCSARSAPFPGAQKSAPPTARKSCFCFPFSKSPAILLFVGNMKQQNGTANRTQAAAQYRGPRSADEA